MIDVGILGMQGSVEEHIYMLSKIENIRPIKVRTKEELNNVSGLIIPGGESTTIGKLINSFDLKDTLIKRIKQGLPVWGTCAGMILMANKVLNDSNNHLGLMNIFVLRNAYGSQLASFTTTANIPEVSSNPIKLVFIRAPWIENVGSNVKVLLSLNKKIVAAKQGNMLVTSFHPELTDDLSFHRYFINMINKYI